jgi:hypothetical protein
MVDIIRHTVHCFSIYEQRNGGLLHQVWPYEIHEIPHLGMGHKKINHKRAWNVKVAKIRVIHVYSHNLCFVAFKKPTQL